MIWRNTGNHEDAIEGTMFTVMNEEFVVSFKDHHGSFGRIRHLKIAWLENKDDVISWDVLQEIKNDLAGTEVQAVEIYPKESSLVNTFPVRHLWVFMDGITLPIGYNFRATTFEEVSNNRSRPVTW